MMVVEASPVPGKRTEWTLESSEKALTRIAGEHFSQSPEKEQAARVDGLAEVPQSATNGLRASGTAAPWRDSGSAPIQGME